MGHLYIFTFYLLIFSPFMVSIQIYYCTKSHFKLINNQNKEFFYMYSGTEPYDMRKCHVWQGCTGRIPFYSGRKLIRLGSASYVLKILHIRCRDLTRLQGKWVYIRDFLGWSQCRQVGLHLVGERSLTLVSKGVNHLLRPSNFFFFFFKLFKFSFKAVFGKLRKKSDDWPWCRRLV